MIGPDINVSFSSMAIGNSNRWLIPRWTLICWDQYPLSQPRFFEQPAFSNTVRIIVVIKIIVTSYAVFFIHVSVFHKFPAGKRRVGTVVLLGLGLVFLLENS